MNAATCSTAYASEQQGVLTAHSPLSAQSAADDKKTVETFAGADRDTMRARE
jgi:hypothetical protein